MFRRARTKHASLPRHQVLKLAELLGCPPESIAETVQKKEPSPWTEQDRKDRAAWPVPLREVVSWKEFVELLKKASSVRSGWSDDVNSLAAAPAIDAFDKALRYASQVAKENPAIAAATLDDAANDLRAFLAGRYLARRQINDPYNPAYSSWVALDYVMEVWIRRETEDLAHVVDRSNEPMSFSDEEFSMDPFDDNDCAREEEWLAWEGKRRLFLQHP